MRSSFASSGRRSSTTGADSATEALVFATEAPDSATEALGFATEDPHACDSSLPVFRFAYCPSAFAAPTLPAAL